MKQKPSRSFPRLSLCPSHRRRCCCYSAARSFHPLFNAWHRPAALRSVSSIQPKWRRSQPDVLHKLRPQKSCRTSKCIRCVSVLADKRVSAASRHPDAEGERILPLSHKHVHSLPPNPCPIPRLPTAPSGQLEKLRPSSCGERLNQRTAALKRDGVSRLPAAVRGTELSSRRNHRNTSIVPPPNLVNFKKRFNCCALR